MVTLPGSSQQVSESVLQRGAAGMHADVRRLTPQQMSESFTQDDDGRINGMGFIKPAITAMYVHMLDMRSNIIKYAAKENEVKTHLKRCPKRERWMPMLQWCHNEWREYVCSRYTSQMQVAATEIF
eukprot:SAG11_NODE_4638_length_1825_cov_2.461182_1_plen_125_part_01